MRTTSKVALLGLLVVGGFVAYGLATPCITEKTKITIDLPIVSTYSRLLAVDDLPNWLQGLEKVEAREKSVFPGLPSGSYDLMFNDRTFSNEMQLEVLDIQPLRSVKIRLSNEDVEIECTLICDADGLETDIAAESVVRGKTLAARVILPFMKRRLLKEKNDNLRRFKALSEGK